MSAPVFGKAVPGAWPTLAQIEDSVPEKQIRKVRVSGRVVIEQKDRITETIEIEAGVSDADIIRKAVEQSGIETYNWNDQEFTIKEVI